MVEDADEQQPTTIANLMKRGQTAMKSTQHTATSCTAYAATMFAAGVLISPVGNRVPRRRFVIEV